MDSIYKLMNKINDQDSLTEKYNVKDEKDLVTLHESLRKPLNESNSFYTSHGTMVLSPAKRAPIPVNSYVSIDLDNATADKMNIKIGSKAKISQLVGQVTGVYNPAGNDQEYAAMLNHLTGSNIRVSTVKDQVIYRIRMHDMFKATQGRDRDILIPAHFVSSITEEDYINAVNRAFPRKGLDKLVHGKDKRFNHVDSSGHTYFKKDKKNEAFYDYDDEHEELAQEFYERAEEEINKRFNCTGAFLEPSTQMGRGRTFLFADDMRFKGSFDFETGEEYIYNNDFDGFLQLVLNSFKPVVDENLESKRVVKKKKITESLSTEAEWEELDSAETMDDERSWQPLRLWKNKTENKYVIIIGDNYPWEGYVNMEFDNEAEAEHEFAAYLNEPYYNTDYEDDYDDDIDEKYDVKNQRELKKRIKESIEEDKIRLKKEFQKIKPKIEKIIKAYWKEVEKWDKYNLGYPAEQDSDLFWDYCIDIKKLLKDLMLKFNSDESYVYDFMSEFEFFSPYDKFNIDTLYSDLETFLEYCYEEM